MFAFALLVPERSIAGFVRENEFVPELTDKLDESLQLKSLCCEQNIQSQHKLSNCWLYIVSLLFAFGFVPRFVRFIPKCFLGCEFDNVGEPCCHNSFFVYRTNKTILSAFYIISCILMVSKN